MSANESLQWTCIETVNRPPQPRSGHSAVIYNGSMYIFGGL
ncbi:unnamed protein product, partial [Rotaria magnacalcarata]